MLYAERPAEGSTFFYGTINSLQALDKGVSVSTVRASYFIASANDKGLEHLVIGKRRLVIIKNGKIMAVFIRPRIRLIRRLEAEEFNEKTIAGYRPIYPAGLSHLPKKQKK